MIAPPPSYFAAQIDVASSLSSRLLSPDPVVRAVAVEQVLAHPASVALVTRSRAEYDRQATEAFATLNSEELAANCRAARLPVGPLEKPGPALLDAWR